MLETLEISRKVLVRLAALAYEDYSVVKDGVGELGVTVIEYFERDGTEAYLFENATAAALIIRGSSFSRGRVNDIVSNIGMTAREWDGPGRIHRGYLEQFHDIKDDVLGLADLVRQDKDLIIGGHSMGGSVANVFAAFLLRIGWKCAALVTFGAPKSVDKYAAAYIVGHTDVYRFTNRFDFANGWPPTPFLTHPGSEIRLDSGGSWWPFSRHTPENFIKAIDRKFP